MKTIHEVIKANIEVHTAAVDKYQQEPHYRPENKARIRDILNDLQGETEGKSLLDVGCGMGFIIDIAKEFFSVIRGVDVTPAMLERVDLSSTSCDIKVELSQAEQLPFPDNTFDVCTAHALLHHLDNIAPVIEEIHRVLRPGGIFYSDLDPNAYFWQALRTLDDTGTYNNSINKEIQAVKNKDIEIADLFHLDVETVQKAEHWMHVQGGFREEDLLDQLMNLHFSSCRFNYHWFIGEARIIHEETTMVSADFLRNYLHEMWPLTRHLFKYIGIIAKK